MKKKKIYISWKEKRYICIYIFWNQIELNPSQSHKKLLGKKTNTRKTEQRDEQLKTLFAHRPLCPSPTPVDEATDPNTKKREKETNKEKDKQKERR